jgi:hypothetical protein
LVALESIRRVSVASRSIKLVRELDLARKQFDSWPQLDDEPSMRVPTSTRAESSGKAIRASLVRETATTTRQ